MMIQFNATPLCAPNGLEGNAGAQDSACFDSMLGSQGGGGHNRVSRDTPLIVTWRESRPL
jgi:hypothetical protein